MQDHNVHVAVLVHVSEMNSKQVANGATRRADISLGGKIADASVAMPAQRLLAVAQHDQVRLVVLVQIADSNGVTARG